MPTWSQPQRSRRLRLLSHGEQVGYTIFETPDQRQLMHLRPSEYNVGRILGEMERDRLAAMCRLRELRCGPSTDALWRSHRNLLFQQWLWFCYQSGQPDRLRLNRHHKGLDRSGAALRFNSRSSVAMWRSLRQCRAAPKGLKVLFGVMQIAEPDDAGSGS